MVTAVVADGAAPTSSGSVLGEEAEGLQMDTVNISVHVVQPLAHLPTPVALAGATEVDPQSQPAAPPAESPEVMHRTRAVNFLGCCTPIIYQNDNGPCPLLTICNVLLLKNVISLNLDASEVSQQKLLSLVAERLIDSNSAVQDKDEEYVRNREQNITDAIDLLPRLTTGIDATVMFRKIDDFEFTRERAIFDLLDIPLYHGWIVDPQLHRLNFDLQCPITVMIFLLSFGGCFSLHE
ncbi:ubiquitin carboxyl-terminal hydrolase MINDY-1-like [Panicum hallii]|uniref:ubiquitin carboxyl-terminal hydrolase MINDY-1-like n=1 Tax=Panicum hallii TaxID=206008 RepID=UPI000DF4DDD8|nr:ubiquitin carboxyl-terminal hydrolase MINDY-1-like [Panicum hallii]